MTRGSFRAWPGTSNGTGTANSNGSEHVETPEECPRCGKPFDGRLPAHIRNDCEGGGR